MASLDAVRRQDAPPAEFIVVVDGGSEDVEDVAAAASAAGASVVRVEGQIGPAAARNLGARRAEGDVVFFVDADVALHGDAVARVQSRFSREPGLAGVFGSYDDAPAALGLVSQYRNLLHHFVHQGGRAEASTFWAGCGALRRDVFLSVGGFDERYREPSVEDIELGCRLTAAAFRIRLDKELQGRHLKEWSFRSMVRTDVLQRALPWTELIARGYPLVDDLNLRRSSRLSAVLVLLAAATLPLALAHPAWLLPAGVAGGGALLIDAPLYSFFCRKRGLSFAAVAVALHWLYYAYSAAAFTAGMLRWWRPGARAPRRGP